MVAYGDGLGSVDIGKLVEFHNSHGGLATVTAVRPPARFGALTLEDGLVTSFSEKPQTDQGWINGGYFVFEHRVLDFIEGENVSLEREPLSRLAAEGHLHAFQHSGFWQPMDTQREKQILQDLWDGGRAPWKVWT